MNKISYWLSKIAKWEYEKFGLKKTFNSRYSKHVKYVSDYEEKHK
jgi:hypothetical protein